MIHEYVKDKLLLDFYSQIIIDTIIVGDYYLIYPNLWTDEIVF